MKIPILMYHSISDGNNPLSVPIKNFEKQMKFMSHNDYKTINLKDLSNLNKYGKFFIITFDDGYEDVFVNALPILNKYDFTATCFFVSKYIGKHNIWDENKSNYIKLNLMNKEQVYEWSKNGMEIGSHSLDHKNLKDLNYNDKYSQITEPKKTFNKLFSIDIKSFSYPFGKIDDQSVEIVQDNYSYAVTTNRSRFTFNKFDNFKLPTINNRTIIFVF